MRAKCKDRPSPGLMTSCTFKRGVAGWHLTGSVAVPDFNCFLLNSKYVIQRVPGKSFLYFCSSSIGNISCMYKIQHPRRLLLFSATFCRFGENLVSTVSLSFFKKDEERKPAFSAISQEAFYLFKPTRDFSHIDISIHLLICWTLNCTAFLNETGILGYLVLLRACIIPSTHMVFLLYLLDKSHCLIALRKRMS